MAKKLRTKPSRAKAPAKITRLVCISDTHCGSAKAVMPAGLTDVNDNELVPNRIQSWLNTCWENSLDWVLEICKGSSFALLLNGDLVEGIHHGTTQIVSPELADHVMIANALLSPLVERAERTFICQGTEVHTRNVENHLGNLFGAVKSKDTGRRTFEHLYVDIHSCRISATHHINATSRPYLEASQYSIHLGVERIEAVRSNQRAPDIVLRAHRHRYGLFDDGNGMLVVTPPWQALTRHGHKAVPAARCMPGIVILDWTNLPEGHLPRVERRIYEPEQPEVISL